MTTAIFDTLKASDNLKAAGIEAKQAEAIVHTMAGAFEDTVATKADLKIEIGAIRGDIEKLEASVKADIAAVRADMDLLKADMLAAFSNTVNRMLLAQLAIAGLLFAALKLF